MKTTALTALFVIVAAPLLNAQFVEVNIARFKPTFGDVAFGAPTSRGNDGIDGTTDAGNWTHADYPGSAVPYPGEIDLAPNPYWQVDFGEAFDLTRLQLVDRVGCCDPQRLEGSTITLLDFEGEVVGTPIMVTGLAPSNPAATAVLDFDNEGAGWFGVSSVRIDGLDTNQYFQFSEFRAFSLQPEPPDVGENAALGRPVVASGATWGGQGPELLTDGRLDNQSHPLAQFGTLGFTYTVDLGMSFALEEIVLWNRIQGNCCPERLSNYRVSLHEDDGAGAPGPAVWSADIRTDGTNSGLGGDDRLTGDLDAAGSFTGQFIVVENLSDGEYNPQIAELEAFTFDEVPEPPIPPRNYADSGVTGFFDSAGLPVGAWGGQPPANATDGFATTFTHPLDMASAGYYFESDMGEDVVVGTIELAGRTGCCPERLEDATVQLLDAAGNVVFSQVMAGQVIEAQSIDLSAAPPVARFVRVVNSNGTDYGPQLAELVVRASDGPPVPFEITGVSVEPVNGMVSLTFNSVPGATYSLFASSSLAEGLWEEINDSVPSDGAETIVDFIDAVGAGMPTRLYRLVRN
jgi:hypothetical protein